jgi:tyrosyl-tRNA synthetase
MKNFKEVRMNLLEDLQQRGLIKDTTGFDELKESLTKETTLFCGFDPTSDSLHVGSLLPLVTLLRFSLAGHKPIALIGGATGMIGDPSGKSDERSVLSDDVITNNSSSILNQISTLTNGNVETINNLSWFKDISVIDFMRDFGKCFSVNAMIRKESVKSRIEREGEGISFTEFSYMLFQSVDFLHLNKNHNCTLQIGGSDQWGNITAGTDLINRAGCGTPAHGLTIPLLIKSDGGKFGKSEKGNIWLDKNKTGIFEFFQFWLGANDDDVFDLLKKLTFLSVEEINKIKENDNNSQGKPQAQLFLARELTRLVHGVKAVFTAEKISLALFSGCFDNLSDEDFIEIEGFLGKNHFKQSEPLLDILIKSELASSKRQAREFLRNNAISINGEKVVDSNLTFDAGFLFLNKWAIIKKGKKKIKLIKILK